ncbi:PLP-dependent aminotransferase family protein [Pseudochrobactrum sp. MP213Fo]|uniref:MocR-like pyridoxine biosynthesis transcription factor PdxR n=1 Tax=Pseudochrobactrum sp. MP213Fo TaxID=3022250 RepID=UPI003BA229B7
MKSATVSETTFFLDRSSRTGLQSQIREIIVSAVLSGQVIPGAKLPSTRKLADYLNISRLTITLAYQELAFQGYLEVKNRSAYHISKTPPINTIGHEYELQSGEAVDWDAKIRPGFSIAKTIRKPLDWRSYKYPFLYGQMDHTLFDLAGWRDCARRALSREDFAMMAGDFAAEDDIELVNYIRSRTLPSRGIRAEADEILVTVGAQNALWIVTQLLLSSKSHAVFENPGHPDILATLHLSGARVTALDVDGDGLPPEKLPRNIDAVFVTPSHQSPTAATMPRPRRIALLEAAAEQDFVIVEDDYEFEMSFLQPSTPALKSLDKYGRVLYVGSFSKSLFPGLRLGYLVAPAPVIRQARALRALMLRHPPGHLQRTAAYFLGLGHYDSVIHRMRMEYHKRHIVMVEALKNEGLHIAGKSAFGGTAFWIEGPKKLDADRLTRELREKGILIESGSPFFAGPSQPCRFFRMAYSSIVPNRIAEGVAMTAAHIKKLNL